MATYTGRIYPAIVNFKGEFVPEWLDSPIEFKPEIEPWIQSALLVAELTNTQPVDENPQNFNGIHMPSFADDFYNRMHVTPAFIDAGNLIGEQTYQISVFNAFFTSQTIDAIAGLGLEGITFDGIAPPVVLGPLQTVLAEIKISTQGPPSINGQITFSFGGYRDIVLQMVGKRVTALPYQPKLPFTESLEWNNQILTSNNGSEQRICMRMKPRQSFSAAYPVPAEETARANNLIFGWIGQRWGAPVWGESQLVKNVLNTDVINCETGTTDIRINGLVLVWASPTDYEVLEVKEINSGNIVTKIPSGGRYRRALLMPIRTATTPGEIGFQKSNYGGTVSADFFVVDNLDLEEAEPPEQFLNEDIYFDPALTGDDGQFSDQYQTNINRIDYGTSIETWLPWLKKKIPRQIRYVFDKRADQWQFRKWLHRRKGTLRPYWLPTFENNLRLKMTGPIANVLHVYADDYKGFADARKRIAIQLLDESWHVFTINGVSILDGETNSVSIDGSLSVDASLVRRVSFLSLYRLNSDKVQIDWIGNGVASCSLNICQIDS